MPSTQSSILQDNTTSTSSTNQTNSLPSLVETLPIIDISPFLDPTSTHSARHETAAAINSACLDYGFFYLTGHGIPLSTMDEILSLAERFFALPLAEKEKIKRFDAGGPEGGDGARGYQGLGENVTGGLQDLQEAVDWYREWDDDKREVGDGGEGTVKALQGVNLWPEEPRELKEKYLAYIEQAKGVGKALVHAMGMALDLGTPEEDADEDTEDEKFFVRKCADSFWVMRMIGYPPLSPSTTDTTTDTAPSLSCGSHTDYGSITLLLASPSPHSLQILVPPKNPQEAPTWLPLSPPRGTFVVNIGDMIEQWTNGYWKSTLHRVVHRGDEYRVSVPFFYEPAFGAGVRPLRRFVEEGVGGKDKGSGGGGATGNGEGFGNWDRTYGEHLLTKVFSNFYFSKRTEW